MPRLRQSMTTAPQATGLAALADRIELWPIEKLRPYERNPRTHYPATAPFACETSVVSPEDHCEP
jgi:hypothetical protein